MSNKGGDFKIHLLSQLQEKYPCLVNPENVAMLQALQSRSHKSVLDLAATVEAKGSDSFINQYVINYGHDSIAECAHTVVFFEGVSLLAAMALEDYPLFAGIESSTRYMDFSSTGVVIPPEIYDNTGLRDTSLHKLYKQALSLYEYATVILTDHFSAIYPDSSPAAIKNKVFDVARGFLPAGIKTNLSLAGSLGKIKDWLIELTFYPLKEVRLLAEGALSQLEAQFPSTYSNIRERQLLIGSYIESVNCLRFVDGHETLIRIKHHTNPAGNSLYQTHLFNGRTHTFNDKEIETLTDKYRKRLNFAQNICRYGVLFDLAFMLDVGSFRDLHRHRRGYCPLPIASSSYDFSMLYLSEVNDPDIEKNLRVMLMEYHNEVHRAFSSNLRSDLEHRLRQYFVLLGSRVPCTYICDLTQLAYIVELRSSEAVHFSLRSLVKCFMLYIKDTVGNSVYDALNVPADFLQLEKTLPSEKRATQTIFTKEGKRLEDV